MRLADRLFHATAALAAAGIDEPRREARLLLSHATGLSPVALLRHMDSEDLASGYEDMVARRAAREPFAMIVGYQPFWTFNVAVSPDTLIPRADSETVVEAAKAACAGMEVEWVLDLGTGTGCLLFAALIEFPNAWGLGIDRSPGAARLAQRNAALLDLSHRAAFACGDWAEPIAGRFDLVLSNPPYVQTQDIPGLMPEVAWYEPASALDGGTDGLQAYRSIIANLPILLVPGGVAILELGHGQADAVAKLAEASGLQPGLPISDLAGISRALPLRMPKQRGKLGKKSFGEAWNRS